MVAETRCHVCDTKAAEAVCHICKTPRLSGPELAKFWADVDAAIKREKEEPRWLRELKTGGRDPFHGQ